MTKLYEAHDHILIETGYPDPVEHRHRAAHIILAVRGDLQAAAHGTEYACRGIVIPSGVSHRIDTGGKKALVFLYDAATDVGRQIRSIRCIPDSCCRGIVRSYMAMTRACTAESYWAFEQNLLTRLDIAGPMFPQKDERILSAMEYIQNAFPRRVSCPEAARAVHLSAGRFSHLFKKQVGMTFSAYLIYQRLMYVYARVISGAAITDAALEAGFSSSTHFAEANRRVFGISASRVLRDLDFIKLS